MAEHTSYDVRGSQSRIFRLFCFDKEGLLHMAFYRIAIFVAMLLAASIIISMAYYGTAFTNVTKMLFILMWILFTPQLFETLKAAMVIASDGIVFGHLNPSFVQFAVKKTAADAVFRIVPYAGIMVWALGFIGLVYVWFV